MAIENQPDSDYAAVDFDFVQIGHRMESNFPWSQFLNLLIRIRRNNHLLHRKNSGIAILEKPIATGNHSIGPHRPLCRSLFLAGRSALSSEQVPWQRIAKSIANTRFNFSNTNTTYELNLTTAAGLGRTPTENSRISWTRPAGASVRIPAGQSPLGFLTELEHFIQSDSLRIKLSKRQSILEQGSTSAPAHRIHAVFVSFSSTEVDSRMHQAPATDTSEREDAFECIRKAYDIEGIIFTKKAFAFLKKFGGCTVRYRIFGETSDCLSFCADEAVCGLGDGALANLEERLNVGRLCPIGRFCFGMRLLLMNADGAVYGVGDEGGARIASSGEEAIDLILSGKLSDRPFDEFTLY